MRMNPESHEDATKTARMLVAIDKFKQVQIDLYSGLPPTKQGYTSIIVVTDVITKYVVLAPLLHKTLIKVAKAFWKKFVIYH